MKFFNFANLLQTLELTKSRNDMTTLLADFFKTIEPDEYVVVYLIQARLKPKFEPIEFNFSQKLILKALNTMGDADSLFRQLGDCGLVAEALCSKHNSDLEILDVYESLLEIAQMTGVGSQEAKIQKYLDLVKNVKPLSAKYITRVLTGNLRLGLSDKTVLDAISWMLDGSKSLRPLLDRAYGLRSDIGEITKIALSNSDFENAFKSITLKPLTPVASKLVERASSVEEVWERMPNCYVQPKLDGLRGQIHFDGNNVQIFSRNMESLTTQFPEVVSEIKANYIEPFVIDSEIIGWDKENNEFLPFQETIKRRRKYNINQHSLSIPIRVMCFDILYYDGKDLTQISIDKRISILQDLLNNSKNEHLQFLETRQVESQEELTLYFEDKVYSGLEGVITKAKNSVYEPGTRNFSWIKLKANTKSDLVDTIDVVVMGYYFGKGARAKFGVGTLLAGVYDPDTDAYFSLGKVGSGFTDEDLVQIKNDLKPIEIFDKPQNYHVDKALYPDVWTQPKIIMEIVADEITRSAIHTAGKGIETNLEKDDTSKGLSVRFPRMKVWNRIDKDMPTTVQELIRMYELRKS